MAEPLALAREKIEADAPRLIGLAGILDAFNTDAERRHKAKLTGRPLGPVPALPRLAAEYGGALPPGLHIVQGSAGTGKTAYALQMACDCQCPALFVTCEMTPLELLRRITARVTGTFLGRLKSGEFPPEEALQLARRAVETCPDLWILDATTAAASTAHIQESAKRARGTSEHFLLVVDSLHSWAEAEAGHLDQGELIKRAVGSLKALSARMDCPVMAISEITKASQAKDAPRDGLNAGADTRKISFAAESLVMLTAAEDGPTGDGQTMVTAKFAKNRNGTKGATVELLFNGALQRFKENPAG